MTNGKVMISFESRRLAGSLMAIIIVLGTVQIFHYDAALPAKVATHFNGQGKVNGWMSKKAFILYTLGMYYFMGGLFFISGWIIPKLPSGLINIPNRMYWLHPARKEHAIDAILHYLYWIGAITLLYLLILTQMTIEVNLNHSNQLNSYFWIVTASYLIGLGYLGWKMYRHFKPVSLT